MLKNQNHFEVSGSLLDDLGYTSMLQNEKTLESEGRLENLKKLIVDIKSRPSLSQFLEEVSLLSENTNDPSNLDKSHKLFSAKGLELTLFFAGAWKGIFKQRNLDENGNKGRRGTKISYVNYKSERCYLSLC